jgi:hypothetical protein
MFETVTVEDAIKRGKRMITYPTMIIGLIILAGEIVLKRIIHFPDWELYIIMILSITLIQRIYWCFAVTQWRIWAFDNVRNVHELKEQAIKAKLLFKDGSFMEKLAIKSEKEKEKLSLLKSKFEQPDVFFDDSTVPDETIVSYSKSAKLIGISSGIVAILIGLVVLYISVNVLSFILLIMVVGYLFSLNLEEVFNKKPVIILSNKGLKTLNTSFFEWGEIKNERVILQNGIGNNIYYLVYDYPGGSAKLNIHRIDMSREELENLLHIYRLRYNESVI